MGVLLLAAIIVTLCAILYWKHRKEYGFAEKWPTAQPAHPLIGNTMIVLGKSDVQRYDTIYRLWTETDRITKVWAGPKLLLMTSHPDVIQKLLLSPDCLEKPFMYSFAGFEQGLFPAKYDHWKGMRKRLNATFNQNAANSLIPIFVKHSQRMIAALNKYGEDESVNVARYTGLTFLETALETTLGGNGLQRPGEKEFKSNLDKAFNIASQRMISPYFYWDALYNLTNYHRNLLKARKSVCDFFIQLITERKQFLSNNNGTQNETNDECACDDEEQNDNKPKVFVDELLKVFPDGKTFTETEITDNMYAVLTGAIDTSSLVTAHACLFMSWYPNVQNRLFEEINEFYPAESTELDFSPKMLKNLRYTDMFLNEALRFWPVVPQIARQNLAEIEIDGVKVPPGQTFVIGINGLHHRKDVWGPNADKFDPENFAEERMKERHSYAFVPFSGGKRICLGYKYAQVAMKVMLIHMVRNFKFSTKLTMDDIRFKHDLTMKPAFDHWVQLSKRYPAN